MSYDIVMNAEDHKLARKIIKSIQGNMKCAQIAKNMRQETNILSKAFLEIKNAIQDIFPEVCKKELFLYLFDRAEGKRLHCDGLCIPIKGNPCVIGINAAVLLHEERLIYCLLHEITHLRFPEHTERFYGTLDALVCIYNERTGNQIEDKWENREKRMEEWNARKTE